MSLNKIFDEFNDLYGLERKPVDHNLESMVSLISDEVNELGSEVLIGGSAERLIKEAIDTIYITARQLRERGVDLDAALAEVHRSNMSKVLPLDTEICERELTTAEERYPKAMIAHSPKGWLLQCGDTGKVIKPTTYSPAVITKDMY